MSDAEKTKKTSIGKAERKANLRRQFAERAIKGNEGIGWRLLFLFFRFLDIENRSVGGWIVLLIVFLAAVWILNVTLEHFGVTPPFEEREAYRPLSSGSPSK